MGVEKNFVKLFISIPAHKYKISNCASKDMKYYIIIFSIENYYNPKKIFVFLKNYLFQNTYH